MPASAIQAGKIEEIEGIRYKSVARIIYADQMTGTMAWVCMTCGVVIGDGPIHSRWHNDGSP